MGFHPGILSLSTVVMQHYYTQFFYTESNRFPCHSLFYISLSLISLSYTDVPEAQFSCGGPEVDHREENPPGCRDPSESPRDPRSGSVSLPHLPQVCGSDQGEVHRGQGENAS